MIDYRILGPLQVLDDGLTVPLGTTKQQAILALLLLHANEVVPRDRLIDELWGERPPATAVKAVQVYVSQLRKQLPRDGRAITTRANGYLLELAPDELDAIRFESTVAAARARAAAGAVEEASRLFEQALALWRGRVLAGLSFESYASADVERLEELRLAAVMDRIDCELALGRHDRVIGELEQLVAEHPLVEQLHGQRMLALYRSGRQAEALRAYREARDTLVEQFGIEPSAPLQRLEHAILLQDASLDAPTGAARMGEPRPPPPTPPRPEPQPWPSRRHRRLIATAALVVAAVIGAAAMIVAFTNGGPTVDVGPTSLAVIDPDSNEVTDAIELGFKSNLIASGEGHVWVVDPTGSTLRKIDPQERRVTTIGLGVGAEAVPFGVAVGMGAVWVAVHRGTKQFVLELGPEVGEVRNEIPYGEETAAPALFRMQSLAVGDGFVWALDASAGGLWRIDPGAEQGRVLADGLNGLSLAVGRDAVWVAGSSGLMRIDPATGVELNSQPVGSEAFSESASVALGRDAAWFVASSRPTLSKIDPETLATSETYTVGRGPSGVALGEGAVWVANSGDGTVSRVDVKDGEQETVELGAVPGGIVADFGGVWTSPGEPRG